MAKNYKTIALTGTEQKVALAGQNCDIRNDSVDIVYASAEAGITSGADGVLSIPAGQAAKLLDCRGTLYILGTGSVMLCGNDYSELVFKSAATSSGGGGIDQGARDSINAHAGNADIHFTAEKAIKAAATAISNPNMLINSWFGKGIINQRGKTEYTGAGYTVDMWKLDKDGCKATIGDSGIEVTNLSSTELCHLYQVTSDRIIKTGDSITISIKFSNGTVLSNSGVVTEDGAIAPITDSDGNTFYYAAGSKWFVAAIKPNKTINIEWAKLELGSVATPFTPPDPATELVKCQRYYYQSWEGENPSTSGVLCVPAITKTRTMSIDYPVEMAKKPTIMICTSDGTMNAVKAWSSGDIVSDVATHYVSTKRFIVGNESSSFVAGAGYGFHYSASAEP